MVPGHKQLIQIALVALAGRLRRRPAALYRHAAFRRGHLRDHAADPQPSADTLRRSQQPRGVAGIDPASDAARGADGPAVGVARRRRRDRDSLLEATDGKRLARRSSAWLARVPILGPDLAGYWRDLVASREDFCGTRSHPTHAGSRHERRGSRAYTGRQWMADFSTYYIAKN